ncbi:MAG TPA: type VI secretion system baseplate subunit TssK [Gemmatimonadaceae bacterium]|nr:type VI secretion system baseplate subunit TssK [Gemmatimonadaceae bacterium]
MRQLQPVLWTKGVLLSPQHLQMQDRYLEDLLSFRLGALAFRPWGFHRLEIDREALGGGAFAVTLASGIMPDGLLFDAPASDAVPPPKPLDEAWDPDRPTLDIYMTVPEYRPDGFNVASAARDHGTRYRAELLMRRDENNGLAEKPVQVARKNLRFLVEGESLDGSSALPVARVSRGATGEITLDPRFVPPLLDVGASEYLLTINRRLVELLAAKSTTLSGMRRQRNQSLADFGISDVANFWLLYTVNTHLPAIRHLYETRRGHPSELFEAMTALAGALTTFSTVVHPRSIPSYDHANLQDCFTRLDAMLRDLLDTVVPSNFVALPLRSEQPLVHAVALDEDRFLTAPQLYLAVSSTTKVADVIRAVPQYVKVSSGDRITQLIRQALSGVELTHTPSPPSAIPVKLNYQYFQLSKTGPEWDAITRARNLAAYVPAELANPQLELVILLPQGSR